MKLIGYARVSTEAQDKAETIEIQNNALRQFVEEQGHTLVASFEDRAVSGTTDLEDREGFAALLERLAENNVDGVLVYRLDRLARVMALQEMFIHDLQKMGKRIISVCEPDLDSDDQRKLFRQLLGSIAEYERSVIAKRMKAGKTKRAQAAKYNGGYVPYGYRVVDGDFVIDETEAEVVRQIYRLSKKESLRVIASLLTAPPPKGTVWNHGTIAFMLKNPFYQGKIKYGKITVERPDLAIIGGV